MGLIIDAALTTAVALGALILLLTRSSNWPAVALAFVIALPLQPLALYLVRLPVDRALKTLFGAPTWLVILSLFYAPLTEEPAKWLAAAVPAVRRAIMAEPITVALAVGLGFAIGEIWMIVREVLALPGVWSLPASNFVPFVIERLEVCFLHGAFVAPAFVCLARGRSFLLGGLAGMVLHFLLNFPIYLKNINAFGLGEAWIPILLLWVVGFVIGCALMVVWLARRPLTANVAAPAADTP
jgi:RsiW-degrading membrane proteinase PrsW (M82 family)